MEIYLRGIADLLNPFRCLDIYKQETDLVRNGQALIAKAQQELAQAEAAQHSPGVVEITAAKQNAQLSVDFATKALIELTNS